MKRPRLIRCGPLVRFALFSLVAVTVWGGRRAHEPSTSYVLGPAVPGLDDGGVPQGVAYDAESDRLILSHYFQKKASRLYVMAGERAELIRTITLHEPGGEPHLGHVGGITVLSNSLYSASSRRVLRYRLSDVVQGDEHATLEPVEAADVETRASFCTSTPDMLFVGEFAYGRNYRTDASHHIRDRCGVNKYAWVCGYEASDPFGDPTCVLSVRKASQGMHVTDDVIYLSVSCGRKERSRIVMYRNPMAEVPHRRVIVASGREVPLWFLDGKNYLGEIDFPPMAEGIVVVGDQLAVVAESGAKKYRSGVKGALRHVLMLDLPPSNGE